MKKKNIKSQLDYIKEFFLERPNKIISTTAAKGAIEDIYLKQEKKRFEDCDRGIRSLFQKGFLIKVSKGHYKYDPNHAGEDKTLHNFSAKDKVTILKRDNYQCVICKLGKNDGADLQIDHIKPRDQGGLSTVENGQTLCSRHNFIKKNLNMNSLGKKIFDNLLDKSKKNKNMEMEKIATEFLDLFKKHKLF